MASDVDICNMALGHLAHGATISSFSPPDGSVEAGYCSRFYKMARAAAIEAGSWSFARERANLVQTTNPSSVWTYAYARPSNCLRPLRVLPLNSVSIFTMDDSGAMMLDPNESNSASFEIEDDIILSNEPNAVLYYLKDVTDSAKFTPTFVMGLSYLLGSMLAGPIITGTAGMSKADSLMKMGLSLLTHGNTLDARSGADNSVYVASHLRARA
jgi:hypothetical protein